MADEGRFNRLALSAADLKQVTALQKPGESWPDALIEDYLNIIRDLIELAELIEANAAEIFSNNLQLRQIQSGDSARISKLYGRLGAIRKLIIDLDLEVQAKQDKLTWRDEGVDLAPSGSAIAIDFTGAGATATYLAGVVTVDIPGGGSSPIISWMI